MARTKKVETSTKTKKPAADRPKGKTTKKTQSNFNLQRYFSSIRANLDKNRKIYIRYLIITVIIILIAVFAYVKKDWFVAAVVNNQPITTVELYQNLKAKDGKDVLDQLIRDKLITQEANKKGISISSADISKRIDEVTKQVGGKESLDSALAQRNISLNDFKNQIRVQLIVEKILEKDIAVTDKEVEDYIAKNPDETKAQSKDQVKQQIKATKLNDKFSAWYADLQKKSKIIKFI